VRGLGLESEPDAYRLIDREVRIDRVPEETRREFVFDRVVAVLPGRWREDGYGDGVEGWDDQSVIEKIGYLAKYAAEYQAPFYRFVEAAGRTLGMESGQEFSTDDLGHLQQQFRWAHGDYSSGRDAKSIGEPGVDEGKDEGYENIRRVGERIYNLQYEAYFHNDPDDRARGLDGWVALTGVEPARDSPHYSRFGDFSPEVKRDMLVYNVGWAGFTVPEAERVIDNVIEGRLPGQWFDGLDFRDDLTSRWAEEATTRWPSEASGKVYALFRGDEGPPIANVHAASFEQAVKQFRKTLEFIAGDFVLDPDERGGHTFDGKDFQWDLTPEWQEAWDLQHGRSPEDDPLDDGRGFGEIRALGATRSLPSPGTIADEPGRPEPPGPERGRNRGR
jgi:hypothetical protein